MNNQLYDEIKTLSDIIKKKNTNLFVKETTKYDNLKSMTENIFGKFSTQKYDENGILLLDETQYSAGLFIFPKFEEIIELYNLITSSDNYKNYLNYNERENTLKIITDKDIVNAQIDTNTIDFFQGISKYVGENFNEILELKLSLISFPGAYLYNHDKNNFNILQNLNDENNENDQVNYTLTFDNIHDIKYINDMVINDSNITNIRIPFLFYTQICGVYTNKDLTKNVISINKLVHQSFLPVLNNNYEYVNDDNIYYIIQQTLIGITLMSIIMFLIDKENNLTTLDYPQINLSFYQDNKSLSNDTIIELVKEVLSSFTTFKIQGNLYLTLSSTSDTKKSLNINQEKNILFGNFIQDLNFDTDTISSIFDGHIVSEDVPMKVESIFSKYINSKEKDVSLEKVNAEKSSNPTLADASFININKPQQQSTFTKPKSIKLNIQPKNTFNNPLSIPKQQPSPEPSPQFRPQQPSPQFRPQQPSPLFRPQQPSPQFRPQQPSPLFRPQQPSPLFRPQQPSPQFRPQQTSQFTPQFIPTLQPQFRPQQTSPQFTPQFKPQQTSPQFTPQQTSPQFIPTLQPQFRPQQTSPQFTPQFRPQQTSPQFTPQQTSPQFTPQFIPTLQQQFRPQQTSPQFTPQFTPQFRPQFRPKFTPIFTQTLAQFKPQQQ
jgi:hypothetical protein